VTELKRRFEEEQFSYRHPLIIKKPLFLEEKKGLSAAEAGTIMHFAMQHLDLCQGQIENQITGMVEKDLLTAQQARSIDPGKIRGFTDSLLGRRMLASEQIHREVPFNLEIPAGK
jgi:ATP-dependent helicase/nuclease subunit A